MIHAAALLTLKTKNSLSREETMLLSWRKSAITCSKHRYIHALNDSVHCGFFFRTAGSDAADHLVVVRKTFDWCERTNKTKCSLRVLWDVGDVIQQHRLRD